MITDILEKPASSAIDPFSAEYFRDPYPFHAQLRDAGPVVWLEKWGVWAVARFEQVQAVLGDWRAFCSGAGVGIVNEKKMGGWRKPSALLETDPPEHTANRAIVSRILSPVALRALRATFEKEAEALVSRVVGAGDLEGMADFSEAFPMKVFADAVGVPVEGRHHLVPWGNMVFNGMGPRNALFDRAMANADEVTAWISAACRRENLTSDGLGAQVYKHVDAGEISEEHAALLVRSFLSAGVDTTTFAIGNALFCFAQHAEQWDMVRANPGKVKHAFEEIMRFESPFQTFFRTATCDTEISGVAIPQDSKVLISVAAANRDPRKWSNPDTFDIGRSAAGHVGFGAGIHGCVGQMIARLEVEVLLTALAKRASRIEMIGEPERLLHNTLRSFATLPVRFHA
ncbi:MAG: cytochrome P450 [Rhizobium sp.]|nr:MAG: cytochrome P450 [Rhizobium sp.]